MDDLMPRDAPPPAAAVTPGDSPFAGALGAAFCAHAAPLLCAADLGRLRQTCRATRAALDDDAYQPAWARVARGVDPMPETSLGVQAAARALAEPLLNARARRAPAALSMQGAASGRFIYTRDLAAASFYADDGNYRLDVDLVRGTGRTERASSAPPRPADPPDPRGREVCRVRVGPRGAEVTADARGALWLRPGPAAPAVRVMEATAADGRAPPWWWVPDVEQGLPVLVVALASPHPAALHLFRPGSGQRAGTLALRGRPPVGHDGPATYVDLDVGHAARTHPTGCDLWRVALQAPEAGHGPPTLVCAHLGSETSRLRLPDGWDAGARITDLVPGPAGWLAASLVGAAAEDGEAASLLALVRLGSAPWAVPLGPDAGFGSRQAAWAPRGAVFGVLAQRDAALGLVLVDPVRRSAHAVPVPFAGDTFEISPLGRFAVVTSGWRAEVFDTARSERLFSLCSDVCWPTVAWSADEARLGTARRVIYLASPPPALAVAPARLPLWERPAWARGLIGAAGVLGGLALEAVGGALLWRFNAQALAAPDAIVIVGLGLAALLALPLCAGAALLATAPLWRRYAERTCVAPPPEPELTRAVSLPP